MPSADQKVFLKGGCDRLVTGKGYPQKGDHHAFGANSIKHDEYNSNNEATKGKQNKCSKWGAHGQHNLSSHGQSNDWTADAVQHANYGQHYVQQHVQGVAGAYAGAGKFNNINKGGRLQPGVKCNNQYGGKHGHNNNMHYNNPSGKPYSSMHYSNSVNPGKGSNMQYKKGKGKDQAKNGKASMGEFYSGSNNMNNEHYLNPGVEAVKLNLSEALGDDQLDRMVQSGREEEAALKAFLDGCGGLGPTAEFERSCNPDKFARREREAEQQRKKPFGGYAMQLLYMRYLEYAQLRKKIDLNIAINTLANTSVGKASTAAKNLKNGVNSTTSTGKNGEKAKKSSKNGKSSPTDPALENINFQALGVHVPLDRNESAVSNPHMNNHFNATANSELGVPLTIDVEALARLQRETVEKTRLDRKDDGAKNDDCGPLDRNDDTEGRLDLGHPLIQIQLAKHNQVSQCFPWVASDRKYLRETEASSLEEAQHLALPKNIPMGPTPYEQQYVIPGGGSTPFGGNSTPFGRNHVYGPMPGFPSAYPSVGGHYGSARNSVYGSTFGRDHSSGMELPITEKPIPISLFAAQERAKSLGEELPSAQNLVVPTELGADVVREAVNSYAQLVASVNEGNFSSRDPTPCETPVPTPQARNGTPIPAGWGPPASHQPFQGQPLSNRPENVANHVHNPIPKGKGEVHGSNADAQVSKKGLDQTLQHSSSYSGQTATAKSVLRLDDNRPKLRRCVTEARAESSKVQMDNARDQQKPAKKEIDIPEIVEALCMHVERLGTGQLLDWDKGRDIVELEHTLIVENYDKIDDIAETKTVSKEDTQPDGADDCEESKSSSAKESRSSAVKKTKRIGFDLGDEDVENLLLIHQSTSEREAMFDRRVLNVGEKLVKKYSSDKKLDLLRQTYRLRNVGINPHDYRLFKIKEKPLSNPTIKSVVRHIKDKQVQRGNLVLRNQTRIATKKQLVDALLGGGIRGTTTKTKTHSDDPKNCAKSTEGSATGTKSSETSATTAETSELQCQETAFDLLLRRLRIVVSIHSTVELGKVSKKWSTFFDHVDPSTPSLEQSIQNAKEIILKGKSESNSTTVDQAEEDTRETKPDNDDSLEKLEKKTFDDSSKDPRTTDSLLRAFLEQVDFLSINKTNDGKEFLEEKKLDLSVMGAEMGLVVGAEGGFFDD